jgi:Ca2+-binding RTX toxin-like protein
MKSPTVGGDLPSDITAVGGIVLDLIGVNGVRVVVQLAANQLFEGQFSPNANVGQIGVMGGLSPQVLAQLGGGLAQAAVRMTVDDADTAFGDSDYNQNFLMLNDVEIGNLSSQRTEATNAAGVPSGTATGFQNGGLSTGWFLVTENQLTKLFTSLSNNREANFGLRDTTPGDNGYSFKKGIDGGTETPLVSGPNQTPDAVDDVYFTARDGVLTVNAAAGLLANDTDPERAYLKTTLVSGPANGTLTLNPDGSFVYRPNAGFSGADSFTYRTGDGLLGDTATVVLAVDTNLAPIAQPDSYTMQRGAILSVDAARGVLANDRDPEGGELTIGIWARPRNGTLTLGDDGSFVYTPDIRFHGVDTFMYSITDDEGGISVQTVTLTVVNNNTPPVAVDDPYVADRDTPLVVDAEHGVLKNDTDPDGDPLQLVLVSQTSHGTVTLRPDGSFTYVPHANYTGPDSFTYLVRDPLGDESVASVHLNVRPPNGAPVTGDDTYSIDENGVLTVSAAEGVLRNDSDPDGEPLTAEIVQQPRHGTIAFAADGSFVYTPAAGYSGTDVFTYRAKDGRDSAVATVTLVVNAVNEAPVGQADSYVMEAGAPPMTVDASRGVLANDSDPDGDTLTAILTQGPQNGAFQFNSDGSFTYTPDVGFTGTDTFTYDLFDGTVRSPVTVTLTVNPRPGRVITLDDNANRVTYARETEAVIVHALAGNDSITGSRFDDELLLGEGNDEGIGGEGDDVIRGGAGNDKLFGQGGEDVLEGGVGDDLMHGGDGADVMTGGVGNDTYYVHSADDQVIEQAGEGNDNVRSTVTWVLGDHFEELLLEGMAAIDGTGNALDNSVLGNNANNTLYGLDGNDTLGGYGGDDILFGGRGNDRLVGRAGNDILHGGTGDDQYFVDSQDVIVEAEGEGRDEVYSVGDYVLSENIEILRLDGTANLRGEGNSGDNYIAGNTGANVLIGNGGNDQIFGGRGDDTLSGGDGNDRLDGGEGWDILDGGAGDDHLSSGAGDGDAHNRLYGGLGSDTLVGGDGVDILFGDTNSGPQDGDGNDLMRGGGNSDVLFGGQGDDRLYGDAGFDLLFGEGGADYLEGGAGDDQFAFQKNHLDEADGRWDTIGDFHGAGTTGVGEQDVLLLTFFSTSATLEFVRYGANQSQQFYRVIDPENPGSDNLILVNMVGTTNLLTPDDYIFQP